MNWLFNFEEIVLCDVQSLIADYISETYVVVDYKQMYDVCSHPQIQKLQEKKGARGVLQLSQ